MNTNFTWHDEKFMRLALQLAANGLGEVEPNPMVGAVVAKDLRIVGQGFHTRFGQAHAEVEALRRAGDNARAATIYVTLEPCCHHGKQPPCTDALLAAGVARVVTAMVDPFPKVRGRGVKILRAAGIRVDVGLFEDQARELNRVFIKRVTQGLPWVIAKWAQTLDGCVATAAGESKWISSEPSRAEVQVLRGRVDAIIVGLNTVRRDDPLLIARPERRSDIHRIATRIVFDSRCRVPLSSQLVRTVDQAPILVVHCRPDAAGMRRRDALVQRGVTTFQAAADRNGRPKIAPVLQHLGAGSCSNVLVEGGPELMAAFLRQGHVDEAQIYIAPKLIGGTRAKHALAGEDLRRLANATELSIRRVDRVGPDLHITAYRSQSIP